jgi:hypothetical protein
MRPPELDDCDTVIVEIVKDEMLVDYLEVPAVLTSAFIKVDNLGLEEDSLGLVFTNFTSDQVSCNTNIRLDDYKLLPGFYQLCEIGPEGSRIDCETHEAWGTRIVFPISMNNKSTVVYEFTPIITEEWTHRFNGIGNGNDYGRAIAIDSDGYVYVTGESTNDDNYDFDYLTIKYDPDNCETLWVKRYDGGFSGDDMPKGITVNSEGVYVTGYSEGDTTDYDYATIAYDPTTGTELWPSVARYNYNYGSVFYRYDAAYDIALDSDGYIYVTGESDYGYSALNRDYATIKYNPANGDTVWTARYDYDPPGDAIPNNDMAYSIAIDEVDNIYVTGESADEYGIPDYATIKYDPVHGHTVWTARYNGTGIGPDSASAIAVNSTGVYVTGKSWNGTDYDYATVKYDPDGTEDWVSSYNGPGNGDDEAYDIAVNNAGVYVTGKSEGEDTGFDYATIGYDSYDGGTLWSSAARYNHSSFMGLDDEAHAIALDDGGYVYVTGEGRRTGHRDYVTIKYNPSNGDSCWIALFGSSIGTNGVARPSDDAAYDIVVDDSGNVYVTGASEGRHDDIDSFDILTVKYRQASGP